MLDRNTWPDGGVWPKAARAVARIDPQQAVEPLLEALRKDRYHDLGHRELVCREFARIKDPRTIEPMIGLLLVDERETRVAVALAGPARVRRHRLVARSEAHASRQKHAPG